MRREGDRTALHAMLMALDPESASLGRGQTGTREEAFRGAQSPRRELASGQPAVVAGRGAESDQRAANRKAYPWLAAFVDELRGAGFTDVRVVSIQGRPGEGL